MSSESSRFCTRVVPSDSAARSSTRLLSDLEPGSFTTPSIFSIGRSSNDSTSLLAADAAAMTITRSRPPRVLPRGLNCLARQGAVLAALKRHATGRGTALAIACSRTQSCAIRRVRLCMCGVNACRSPPPCSSARTKHPLPWRRQLRLPTPR
eukprot:scaffold6422_cov350-Prasinococcus_capsulatus_cf.AAC.1